MADDKKQGYLGPRIIEGYDPAIDTMSDRIHKLETEIERLREQLKFAHNILGSEAMIWVFHGSDNWHESHINHLRDPIHEYWAKYGNAFKENII